MSIAVVKIFLLHTSSGLPDLKGVAVTVRPFVGYRYSEPGGRNGDEWSEEARAV